MITANEIATSVQALFLSHGVRTQREYVLPNGRRLDIAGIGKGGSIAGVEIKISERDFNRDLKWPIYLQFCKVFYFAVPLGFNIDIIPRKIGIISSNGTTAKVMRGLSDGWHHQPTVLLRA